MIKVGVFDSGIGGKSVADAITQAMPEVEVKFVNDKENVPYGSKAPEELYRLVLPILQNLAKEVDVIVVACNTVSTTLITRLREDIKKPMIALEPMVKPAAEASKSGVIAVCATPTTLASQRYDWLKQTYAANVKVLEPDCSDWSAMIEDNQVNEKQVANRIEAVINGGADQIVLGCTHYHWIEDLIKTIANGRAQVTQPESAIVGRLKTIITEL